MSEDWSFYHGRPRAEVHSEVHGGTPPPRQGLRGGRRVLLGSAPPRLGAMGGRRLTGETNWVGWGILALALIYLASRK